MNNNSNTSIKEFHLFAGIGGGIYGGKILGHTCCGGVEIDPYATSVLIQRQKDGWLEPFSIYPDITKLSGKDFRNSFDVLCGGFPCQAFSTAAHGKNIAEKNLWDYMHRFIIESEAPVVFAENVVLRAITKAKTDLEASGYRVSICRLSCKDLGADHQRNRFWLLAVKDDAVFEKVARHINTLGKIQARCWTRDANSMEYPAVVDGKRHQLRGIGNAQSPLVCACAFRILVNRQLRNDYTSVTASKEELDSVFTPYDTWIQTGFKGIGGLHTPTTMANYHCASMMKHSSCQNFVKVFGKPAPLNGEYLMGFPIGASSPRPLTKDTLESWMNDLY
ncbi:MAG: DNA cytosine methyltransferase [Muribaculaceae bacterium]|nr:DNA cytosine methyltransferase [Muribaculaceae bacterium]